jgi:hypothetical protein
MFTTGTTLSSQHRLVLEQNPKKQQKKFIWLVVHISIHFPSDTDDTSSYSYIQYEDSQENSALNSNVYDIC